MPNPNIIVIALGTVYYLFIYLFVIRRGGKPILPWTVTVLAQIVSAVFYLPAARLIADFLAPLSKAFGFIVTALLFIAANCVIMVLSFKFLVPKRRDSGNMEDEMQDFELKPIEATLSSDFIKKVENATSSAVEEEEKTSGNDDKVLAEIESMIAEGRTDEAVRYLKMIAYYGSNEALSNFAKEKLAELTASMAVPADEDELEVEAEPDNDQD